MSCTKEYRDANRPSTPALVGQRGSTLHVGKLGSATKDGPGSGASGKDHSGLCRRQTKRCCGPRSASPTTDGWETAVSFCPQGNSNQVLFGNHESLTDALCLDQDS